jgi:peptidoglycan pentaglycine glycine transferase (the first glycine)
MHGITDNPEAWNQYVRGHGGNFLQSWQWGEFQAARGRAIRRVAGPSGAAQCVTLGLPLGRKYVYVPRGPVADAEGMSAELVAALCALAREAGADFVKVEPPAPMAEGVTSSLRALGFREAAAMQPAHTNIADLTASEEHLLAAMHAKTRYNIRVAEKHGVTVRESVLAEDVETFVRLLEQTTARDNFSAHEPDYYRTLVASLKAGDGMSSPRASIILAEREGVACAAGVFVDFAGTRTYLHGASHYDSRQYMGPFALHWQAMRGAKAAGATNYDFWGVAPLEAGDAHPWSGITRFKLGFGGTRVAYAGTWELPVNRGWYTVYRAAKRLRRTHP